MPITKEQVVAKATELGLTLTDSQIEQLVKDDKLPVKEEPVSGIDELVANHSPQELAQMVKKLRAEAAEKRVANQGLTKENADLAKKIDELSPAAKKYPELEKQINEAQATVTAFREGEKKRRALALDKLDEQKRTKLSYLLDADKIDAVTFENTLELVTTSKSDGVNTLTPSGGLPTVSLQERLVKARQEGRTLDAVVLQRQIQEQKK
jgi:hypothetical protein